MSFEPEIEANIRNQFVTSLMEYFKIEEDVYLRGHIQELIKHIDRSQFREFLNRLSTREMPYKTAFEKIALVAKSIEEEMLDSLFKEVRAKAKRLFDVMYELHRQILLGTPEGEDAKARFGNVHFARIRDKASDTPLLDATDLAVVKALGKAWIFEHVAFDKSLFLDRAEFEYKQEIMRRERQSAPPKLSGIIASRLIASPQKG